LESLRGEASRRMMGQMGQTSTRALEGKTPIGEAHGRPPNLPDPQTQGSIVWEPEFDDPKPCLYPSGAEAVLDKGACVRPDLWPSLSVVIVDPDTCSGSVILLEG